jgi:hypothetical protein
MYHKIRRAAGKGHKIKKYKKELEICGKIY